MKANWKMVLDPRRQNPNGPETINEDYFDALVRHQIGLLRLSGSIRNKILELLDKTEKDVRDKLRERLRGQPRGLNTPRSIQRLNQTVREIQAIRAKTHREIEKLWLAEAKRLALSEAQIAAGIAQTVSPTILELTIPSVGLLEAMVDNRPFEGKTLKEWAASMRDSDLDRIKNAITIGMTQGDSMTEIIRRVLGTGALAGRDGATQATRRAAEAITRTMVNAIANNARRAFNLQNQDLFPEELYVATLDSRTTPICRSLDGDIFPVGVGPYPPVHFNCRSLRVAIFDGQVLGTRPAKRSTERQLLEEFARREGLDKVPRSRDALPRGFKGKYDDFSRQRIRELTGTVPSKVSYEEWLSRQSAAFQDDVLGKAKGQLFRKGDLSLDKFVNRAGDELTLSELAGTDAKAFRDAGLDPEDFL